MDQFKWIFNITWINGLTALAIFLVFWLARGLFCRFFLSAIVRLSKRSKSKIDDALIVAFRRPISFILLITGIYLALMYLPMPHQWKAIGLLLYKSAATFSIGWGFYIFSDAIGIFFNHMGSRYDLQFNTIVIPFLAKVMKFIVAVLTIAMILDQWNYHVTGLITGLGIGGLAVAMAAKDTLSNLFGGIVIIADAPFTIGDYIQTGTIEGTVEDINFRSTRIRTADLALVTVPNSTLANAPITNLSKMDKRRILLNLPLDLETDRMQIRRCLEKIRAILAADAAVDQSKNMVYLNQIDASSMNLMIDFFINTTDVKEWLQKKEKYNCQILDIIHEEQISLATARSLMIVPRQETQTQSTDETEKKNDGQEKRSRQHL